ncbi:MAG: PilZ domain-containing protein [Deltaproteobacteria bacterium]|nr:PilZ domain-containing protein [Deltaproteobacteria bacterium]
MSVVLELELRLNHPNQLHDYFVEVDPCGGIFVPGYDQVSAGAQVVVLIRFATETYKLRGKVMWRRTRRGGAGRGGLEKGVGVAFAADQSDAVRRMLSFASEPRVQMSKRQSRRLPIALKIRYNSMFSLARDMLRDLSLGGLRVMSDKPPPIGKQLVIYLRPPRALTALRLGGEVVWRDNGPPGSFGVRFTDTSPKDKKRLVQLMWKLEEQAHPQEPMT